MKFEIKRDYFWVNLIVLILVLIITVIPIKSVRIFLGLLFVLFLPGYIFVAALFPKKADVDSIERVALSFGLSIAIVPLIGLILNYTPLGN